MNKTTLHELPQYPWILPDTRKQISAFHAKRDKMLQLRTDAVDTLETCMKAVAEGAFTAKALKAGEDARVQLIIADSLELHLIPEWKRLTFQIRQDADAVRSSITEQIEARKDEIEAAGIAADEDVSVRDAKIRTDKKIGELCDQTPPQMENDRGYMIGLNERFAVLETKFTKLFTV